MSINARFWLSIGLCSVVSLIVLLNVRRHLLEQTAHQPAPTASPAARFDFSSTRNNTTPRDPAAKSHDATIGDKTTVEQTYAAPYAALSNDPASPRTVTYSPTTATPTAATATTTWPANSYSSNTYPSNTWPATTSTATNTYGSPYAHHGQPDYRSTDTGNSPYMNASASTAGSATQVSPSNNSTPFAPGATLPANNWSTTPATPVYANVPGSPTTPTTNGPGTVTPFASGTTNSGNDPVWSGVPPADMQVINQPITLPPPPGEVAPTTVSPYVPGAASTYSTTTVPAQPTASVPGTTSPVMPPLVTTTPIASSSPYGTSPNGATTSTVGNNSVTATPAVVPGPVAASAVSSTTTPDTITIASFNIQVFGESKLAKPAVMDTLAKVARRFDVIAIQEVRSKEDDVIPRFLQQINATGAAYDAVVGPRLGRTNSKEQYAVIYNTARIELTTGSVYTVPDPNDRIQREPMVANFRVRGPPAAQAFTFSLVDIHTTPDDVNNELDALADVYVGVQRNGSGEDDIILLGDLNADEYHLGRLGTLPNITHVITGRPTNTRQNQQYDNMLFDGVATREYQGQAGVLNLMQEYNLTFNDALAVSDHFPIWAVFSAYEAPPVGPLATRPAQQQ
ncbi:MAG: endonuclease/exonuclease/phosphatase family protein [Planctomycetes bacterium]|nr:endonuclease/exonuclease/phosphatase family protein [Planctomycetota bacterium]